MNDWSFNNPVKQKLVEKLTHLNVSRSLMVQSIEVTYFLPIEKLEKIYESLSKNQKKATSGRVILEIINFKKDYLYPQPPQES